MMKAIVRYRDDQDLENVIDFVQKKVIVLYTHTHKKWFLQWFFMGSLYLLYSTAKWFFGSNQLKCYIAPLKNQ